MQKQGKSAGAMTFVFYKKFRNEINCFDEMKIWVCYNLKIVCAIAAGVKMIFYKK